MVSLKQIDFITINVSDMTRSVQFYRDVLGFTVMKEHPHRSVLSLGDIPKLALHLGVARKSETDSHVAGIASITFVVENLESTIEELKAKGTTFLGAPSLRGGGSSMVVELADPDGFHIIISSPVAK